MTEAPEQFRALSDHWRPDDTVTTDRVTALPPAAFAALLDEPTPMPADGDPLPPLWHWFLFPAVHQQSELGADGHPEDGSFTPPLAQRRRMFGGGRLWVTEPLRCGDDVVRRSTLTSVRTREGGSGWLLLVTVRHEFTVDGRPRLVEEQDLIYREPAAPTGPTAVVSEDVPPPDGRRQPDWRLDLRPDPVLLFRFSALTWNAHRIHYDREYAVGVDGHAGLVVHGPLLALLLLELPRRFAADNVVESFSWRARHPLFDHEQVSVGGTPTHATRAVLTAGSARVASAVTGEVRFR
jgi:hydroxyacyl-ACP dehydratase HTD2-like protein with hotdog domain